MDKMRLKFMPADLLFIIIFISATQGRFAFLMFFADILNTEDIMLNSFRISPILTIKSLSVQTKRAQPMM